MRTNLINARKAHNLTQKEIAKIVGITEQFYQSIEYGKKQANVLTWDKLEDLLNISHRELLINFPN